MPELSLKTRDFIGKFFLIFALGIIAAMKGMGIALFIENWPGVAIYPRIELASHFTSLIFIFVLIFMTIIRFEPMSTAKGLEPKISALVGSFGIMILAFLPLADLSPTSRIISIFVGIFGCAISILILFRLGRSFSIMADARRLVTTGPYSIVRHPLYVSEEIAVVGLMIGCLSPTAVAIVVVHFAIQVRRMFNEERVLREAFPEYAAYAEETPMILPGLGRAIRQFVP